MFNNICKCEYVKSFKIEADYHADPIWCNVCGWNLDIDEFPLSDKLKDELYQWTKQYKRMQIKEHNTFGQNLTEKVKEELGSQYKIIFITEKE
ncbi:hypothetical protein [Neobacillus vireti]|uniref:hypothetical protein n=1 Tax=Neobacillus vireti TaxID=220686 RepID=UPI002FFFCE9A